MPEIDFASAIPVQADDNGVERVTPPIDFASAKPISAVGQAAFRVMDSSNILIDTAKSLFRGTERMPAGIGSGMEFIGKDIVAEEKSDTIPLVPYPGLKSISWLRIPKGKQSKMGEAIGGFFTKFGDSLAEIGQTAKDFYNEAASKGIESPNPAVMLGWRHPFRKTAALASENLPMLGIAAGVSAVTRSPMAGAATFFPAISGDMYEEAIKNGVDPLKASDLAVTDGIVQTALENIVLGNWMKGGNILKRVFRTALQEGFVEEGTQQVFENSLKTLNWQDGRPVTDRLLDGLAESILAGTVSGGALGMFEAPHIDDIRYDIHNQVINEGMKQGLSEDEISQTLDKVDEVIDKTIGVEEEESLSDDEEPPLEQIRQEEGYIGDEQYKANIETNLMQHESIKNKTPGILRKIENAKRQLSELNKVIDSEKEGVLLYHGSDTAFENFDQSKVKDLGFHFGSEEQAKSRMEGAGVVRQFRVTIKNPYDISSDLGDWSDMSMLKEYFGSANDGPLSKEFDKGLIKTPADVVKYLKKKGYDGIKYQNSFEGDTKRKMGSEDQDAYIAFDASQIQPITQKESVQQSVAKEPKSIRQIAEETKILEPNVRRILGVGAKDGTFSRVDKGVYILNKNGQDIAYVHTGDAVDVLPKLAAEGLKADMVFLDIPYKTPAVIGGNRGIKYDYITPEQFKKMVDAIGDIVKSDKSPVLYMYSQARSGLKEMQKYTDVLIDAGFKPVAKGNYTKYQMDGITRVRNMRGAVIEPEGILLLTKSGNFDAENPNLNFDLIRPKGYQTEKPKEMVKALIELTTEEGQTVLDPTAGSGVVGAEAVKAGRKAVLIEKNADTVKKFIHPRLEEAAKIATALKDKNIKPLTRENFNQEKMPLPVDQIKVDDELIDKLNQLQDMLGKQLKISSGFRTKEYNEDLKKRGYKPAENSTHLTGRAADIKIKDSGLTHEEIIKAAQELGLAVEDIEQTPYHVHVELPTEGSETPLMKAKTLAKAKIIKSVVEVLPEDVKKVEIIGEEIAAGEAGKRIPTESGWTGIASTFPAYFRDKGYTKKQTLAIIEKIKNGTPVTQKQQDIFNDLLSSFKEQAKQEVISDGEGKSEEQFRKDLAGKGYGGSEIEAIVAEVYKLSQGQENAEGTGDAGLSQTKLCKDSVEAEEFITEIEDKGGQATIVRVSPEEVEVSYVLPDNQSSGLPSALPDEEEGKASVSGKLGAKSKTLPFSTNKIAWEQNEAWKINQGRDITGVFEREIGPKLEVSKRLKKWLGVYYPMLGQNGLIRVRSLDNERTLYHETGHFLDDVLGDYQISKKKAVRDELKAVSQQMRPFDPASISASYKSYRNSKPELFADYISAYVLDVNICKKFAPNFTAEIENTIGKDKEWNYVIDKLHEFAEAMKPLKDYVNALRKIPEIQPQLKEWAEKGNILQELWRNKVGNKVWEVYSKGVENLGKKLNATAFFEKGGMNDTVMEILRQRRKLIHGQQTRLKEDIIEPIAELSKEDQQYIAESLQRFGDTAEEDELGKLTEEARKELAVWGNETRKLGLLNDEIFWNNVGQYFPFFYETKEFEKNKRNFGYFPSKAIRARFESLKHKMSDEEFGRKVLEAQYGTWPSGKKKIAEYSTEELEKLGQNAREELGLIKTAAYPLQKRLFGMIEMVYTVKAFNNIASLPGIIGHKGVEGFEQMPSGKKYGILAEQYVPAELVKEISKWGTFQTGFMKGWQTANSVWKLFKVPYNPAAVSRNLITNSMMAWIGDVPIYNPVVAVKGFNSFIKHDEAYKLLRDHGLYHNNYSEQELKDLAFHIEENSDNPYEGLQKWALKIYEGVQAPAKLYGALEDASKTVIARYVIDNGGTPEEAVKFADKLLFDYSQVSEVTGYARQSFLPFATWSMKVLPRLIETAIRKPEKYIMFAATVGILTALSRDILGIDKDEEEKLKPDYIRGKSVLLIPGRDINGDLNWIDLTYFLPWGSWWPIDKGRLAMPQTLTMGGILPILYNAFVLNYDPFMNKEIGAEYLSESGKTQAQLGYVLKNLAPQVLTNLMAGRLFTANKPDRYGRKKELSKMLAGDVLGVKFTQDTSAYRGKIQQGIKRTYSEGISLLNKKLRSGEISKQEYSEKLTDLKNRRREDIKEH